MTAGWIFQIIGNGFSAAAPAYGFAVTREGTTHGWTLAVSGWTFFYLAIALVKTAFATTLIRLSGVKTKALLYVTTAVVWTFAIALSVCSWLKICDQNQGAVISDGDNVMDPHR